MGSITIAFQLFPVPTSEDYMAVLSANLPYSNYSKCVSFQQIGRWQNIKAVVFRTTSALVFFTLTGI